MKENENINYQILCVTKLVLRGKIEKYQPIDIT